MARNRSAFYDTIEYIGPRPQKPKRRNFFGGWVILVIAVGIATWFGRPLVPFLKAANQDVTLEQVGAQIVTLQQSGLPGDRIAAAALAHSGDEVTFSPDYYKIDYPNGDIKPGKGGPADVIIRCFRKIGVDLQQQVHEDMAENFRSYPQLWGALTTDTSIDHRRIPNLQRFFERKGETLPNSRDAADYKPGDVVVWSLANAEPHIGIVVPAPENHPGEMWVVHNMGKGVKWENVLFDFKVEAHFRYPKQAPAAANAH